METRTRRSFIRTFTAVSAMVMLIGGLLSATAAPASAGEPCEQTLAPQYRDANGFDPCEDELVVFSDAKTGDLWLTDAAGTDPYRLTRTPMVEDRPAALYPWVFYDGTTRDGETDVYQLSLLDPGAGRVRITGLKSGDYDPTAVVAFETTQAESSPGDASAPRALGPGGLFYPVLLAYSSDRDRGKQQGKCGWELFLELLMITGPERISNCDKVDKFDAQLSLDGDRVAYTGLRRDEFTAQIHVLEQDGTDTTITDPSDGEALFPTWNPYCCPGGGGAPDHDPSQPAGSEGLTFTRFGADEESDGLFNIWADGTDENLFYPNDYPRRFWEAEWSSSGDHFAAVQYRGRKSWIWMSNTDTVITDKERFYVNFLDLISMQGSLP